MCVLSYTAHGAPGGLRTPRPPGPSDGRSADNRRAPARRPIDSSRTEVLLRSCDYSPELLYQLSYRSGNAPGGTRTRDLRLGVDNRYRSGPQQEVRRGRGVRSGCGVEPQRPSGGRSHQITEPLRPATTGPPGFEPGPARLELAMLPLHHGPRSGRPGSNRRLRVGGPVLFLLSYVRKISRFPGASLRRRAGQCSATRPARWRVRSGARRRRSPTSPGGSRRRPGKRVRPAGVEPARPPYQSGALH
jgi:hypothetical protein